jgi:hypothetical protein
MEALLSLETSVAIFQSTWRNIPEDMEVDDWLSVYRQEKDTKRAGIQKTIFRFCGLIR